MISPHKVKPRVIAWGEVASLVVIVARGIWDTLAPLLADVAHLWTGR